MLIGIAHPTFETVGGAELLAARHARYFRSMGHEVRLVTGALDPARWPELAAEVDVRVVGKRWTDGLGMPGTAVKLRRRSTRQADALRGCDVVLAENFPGNVVASLVEGVERTAWYCNEPNRRLHPRETFPNLTARVESTRPEDDTSLLALGRRMLARHAESLRSSAEFRGQRAVDVAATARIRCVVTNSAFASDCFHGVYGRRADAVIYPTVEPVPAARRGSGMDPAGLRVLVHGRLEVLKNVDPVILGFAAFRARHPGAHELHVVGRGPDAERLRTLARDCGLSEVAHFHGFVDQPTLEAIYARCEVMALLPPDEPFGMVFAEAAQRGLLLVGPDHGGALEILDGGALGWPVDVFSPEPLSEALAEAWRLPAAEVDRRRERAAAASRDRFGPDATLPRLLGLLGLLAAS